MRCAISDLKLSHVRVMNMGLDFRDNFRSLELTHQYILIFDRFDFDLMQVLGLISRTIDSARELAWFGDSIIDKRELHMRFILKERNSEVLRGLVLAPRDAVRLCSCARETVLKLYCRGCTPLLSWEKPYRPNRSMYGMFGYWLLEKSEDIVLRWFDSDECTGCGAKCKDGQAFNFLNDITYKTREPSKFRQLLTCFSYTHDKEASLASRAEGSRKYSTTLLESQTQCSRLISTLASSTAQFFSSSLHSSCSAIFQTITVCNWFVIFFCGVVLMGLSLSLWWSFSKEDLAGGFILGTFIAGAGCGVVNKLHNRHREDGRCHCNRPQLETSIELGVERPSLVGIGHTDTNRQLVNRGYECEHEE